MKNGYYLATYIEIDEIGNLYKKGQRHDQNISLWELCDGCIELKRYWELERVNYFKHCCVPIYSVEKALDIISMLLKEEKLTFDDIEETWGCPKLPKYRDIPSEVYNMKWSYHSICHLASAVMMSSEVFYNDKILGLSVDLDSDTIIDGGTHKKVPYAGCIVERGSVEYFQIQSPAILWYVARIRFGLEEGSLMALASAINVCFKQPVNRLNFDIYRNDYNITKALFDRYEQLDINENNYEKYLVHYDNQYSLKDNIVSAIMKEISSFSLEIMCKNVEESINKYNIDPQKVWLALSGGFSLNCPTNSHLMKKYGFKGLIVPPCINDSGQSLGIALYNFYTRNNHVEFCFENAFYGRESKDEVTTINNPNFKKHIAEYSEFDKEQAVKDICEGPIVWYEGQAEIGPRALGHRSLLIDPRSLAFKNTLNKIKQRENWRPVAPIMLEEDICEWFDDAYPSPYMLNTFKVKPSKQELIPAVLHLDNSARVQTVNKDNRDLDRLRQILIEFKKVTGVPILGNTSLNDKGEPILDSVEQVIDFALKKNIRIIYVNGVRVALKKHYTYSGQYEKNMRIRECYEENDVQEKKRRVNPHNISDASVVLYYASKMKDELDLKKIADAKMIERAVVHLVKSYGKEVLF